MTVRVAYTLEQCWHRVPGGTATAALAVGRALRDERDVELVGVAARHRHAPPAPWQPPVPVHQLPVPGRLLYDAWGWLGRPAVERATGPVDVVHATTIMVPPRTAPLVVTVHDLAFLHEPAHFTRRGLRVMRRHLDLVRRHADLCLCSSSATLADCAEAGIGPDRLRLVPLGVDVEPAGPGAVAAVRDRLGLGRPYLLFTGTLEPRKNLRGLIEAFRLGPAGLDLVVAGPVGWGDALAPPADLGDRVRLVGFVPPADLPALYAGAAALCYPSLREGFGLPVLEAMAQGTPVVTSQGTSTEEVAGGAAVLVDPRDPADIARGIAEALDRAEVLARAGRARAAACPWAETARRTLAAYREMAP